MKKHLIFTLLSLIFALSATAEKPFDIHPTIKIEANPINIAVMLMQENDTAAIAATLKYYGYVPDTSQNALRATRYAEDGSAVYTHPNGSTIRVSFPTPAENGKRKTENLHTTIEVTSKGTHKEKEQLLLQHLNFQKNGTAYEQKSVGFTTRCTLAPHNTLLLQRIPKKAP